jgi:putative DNA methylase
LTVRPLIEQWFPAAAIGEESLRERRTFTALPAPFAIHVWWARRPLIACRAVVLASLLPAWPTDDEVESEHLSDLRAELEKQFPKGPSSYHEWFLSAVGVAGDPIGARRAIEQAKAAGKTTVGNAYGYDRAYNMSPDQFLVDNFRRLCGARTGQSGTPTVLDPFAGGGSIPLESLRLGFDTIASELNPVAGAILIATLEIPLGLGEGFAATLRTWGDKWCELIRNRLESFYPAINPDEQLAYVWAYTVPCPSTSRPTPLCPNLWLDKSGKIAIRLDPDLQTGAVRTSIVSGPGAEAVGPESTFKNGVGKSIWTGETFNSDYVRHAASVGSMGELLLAVSVSRPRQRGRSFRTPSAEDHQAVINATKEVERRRPQWAVEDRLPVEPIPSGSKTDEPRSLSMDTWADLFLPRQQLALVTAQEALGEIHRIASEQLGELEARAVGLYLSLALDKAADYNSKLTSWESDRVKVAHTFVGHDFALKWSFAEMDGARALFQWAVKQITSTYKGTARLLESRRGSGALSAVPSDVSTAASILVGSATSLDVLDESIDAVVTDPPYYDNVMYAECSDFFWVWLTRSLREVGIDHSSAQLTPKESEAVANPALFAHLAPVGRRKKGSDLPTATELANRHYEEVLTASFVEVNRVLKKSGVLTVMFTHKRIDAWDTLGVALLEAGFSIHSSWPAYTESEHSSHQVNKNSAASTIFLTCRKRAHSETAYWADIRAEVSLAARTAAAEFSGSGLTGIDLTLSTFGPVLSVLSRYWPVHTGELDSDGNSQILRPDVALDLAREEVARLKKRGLLGGRDVEFDRVTDWYLLAWTDFGASEFRFDEGRKLSIAMHLDVDELAKTYKVIRASSGTVTILTPAQRRTAGVLDPDAASWPTLLDALHALMLVYDEEGLSAAKAWLVRTDKADDQRFRDLIEAAIHAIPRAREKGEFARPEARSLEGLRVTLFDDIAPPPDISDEPEIARLFEVE